MHHDQDRACAACEGKGTVQIDAYTGEPVGAEGQRVRSADPRRIDAELAKLAQNEELRRGRHLDDPFAWEAERIRYRQAGSYASLERALEGLRANEPDLYSLTMRTLVYGTVAATPTAQPHLDRALGWIARRMPHEVRVPRWVSATPEKVERSWPADRRKTAARAERNATIIVLSSEGLSQAAIALEVGVSKATVSRSTKPLSWSATSPS